MIILRGLGKYLLIKDKTYWAGLLGGFQGLQIMGALKGRGPKVGTTIWRPLIPKWRGGTNNGEGPRV